MLPNTEMWGQLEGLDPPLEIRIDSSGPAIQAIRGFIASWARERERGVVHIDLENYEYDANLARWILAYQRKKGLEGTGIACDLPTLRGMREDGFDLVIETRKIAGVDRAPSFLVQPDHSQVFWCPYTGIIQHVSLDRSHTVSGSGSAFEQFGA